jgi:rhamnose utilization protein RhaD (predicted bifunctional aldolase and dehydrogenase)
MFNSTNIDDLVTISQLIGRNSSYVQGAGGNISQKISDTEMVIKASGFLLKEIKSNKGVSIVDFPLINSKLRQTQMNDNAFSQVMSSAITGGEEKPSIETGFHALLGKFVIHSHSVFVNTIACCFEGADLIEKNFKDALWIEYATPGRDITCKLMEHFSGRIPKKGVIILQNHGVISWDKTSNGAFKIHEDLNNRIKSLFKFQPYNYESSINAKFENVLFPDQAVFLNSDKKTLNTISAKEISFAYKYILSSIEENQLTPNFLSQIEVDKLVGMEAEKLRVKLAK